LEVGSAATVASPAYQSAEFWQALLATEASPVKSRALIEELGSLPLSEALTGLNRHPGLSDAERRRLGFTYSAALEEAIGRGVRLLTEQEYPEPLAEAAGTPPALFVSGDPECLHAPTVAIVGTRSASTYGKACAHKFAEALARAGVTVISGGALGIDAAAHRGALEAGGHTVAVLAAGVDHVYPAVHHNLFSNIRERGCLVSQFAVGSKPNEYRFIVRNSLVAALSLAVLVIEAPQRSGAIRTAQAAAELGRDVFVVPANIDALSFQGSFALIRDGATLVSHPSDILESLGIEPVEPVQELAATSSAGDQILSVLSVQPLAAERIVERTGLDTAKVLSELTMLELEGRILRDAGGYALKP
jgi:DNA processing protein